MPSPTIKTYLAGLDLLADRSGTVELRAIDPRNQVAGAAGVPGASSVPGVPGTTFKLRTLQVAEDGAILLEMSNLTAANHELKRGVTVEVLVVEGTSRLVGTSRIVGVELFQLNATNKVRALRLERPHRVESAQRRKFFRANAGGASDQPVMLHQVEQNGHTRRVLDTKGCKASLQNLSGGGVGLTIDRGLQFSQVLQRSTHFIARMTLPEQDATLDVLIRLVHMEPIPGDALYLGFEFLFDDEAERRTVEERVVRATTALQRQQIRRRRGG